MVVAVHTAAFCRDEAADLFHFHFIERFINAGARGVQLFFMISAFTLFASSKIRFTIDKKPTISFYLRRAFRILPFWWLINAIYMLMAHRTVASSLPDYFLYFGFMIHRNRAQAELFPMGWSIFVEETFYLFLPLVFCYVTNLSKATWFGIMTLGLAFFWNYAAPRLNVPAENSFVFPLHHWFCFGVGIILYYWSIHPAFKTGILESRTVLVLLDVLAFIILGLFLTSNLILATAALAVMFIASFSEKSFFGKITRNRVLGKYGVYCYSIYLCHALILTYLDPIKIWIFNGLHLNQSWGEVRFFVWFAIACPTTLLAGYVMFNLIEKPCINIGKFIIKKMNGV